VDRQRAFINAKSVPHHLESIKSTPTEFKTNLEWGTNILNTNSSQAINLNIEREVPIPVSNSAAISQNI